MLRLRGFVSELYSGGTEGKAIRIMGHVIRCTIKFIQYCSAVLYGSTV